MKEHIDKNSGKSLYAESLDEEQAGAMMEEWLSNHTVPEKECFPEQQPSKTPGRRALRAMRAEDELDLHGMTSEAALNRVKLFLRESLRKGYKKVRIIHGKGNHSSGQGVLKKIVREYLTSCHGVGQFGDCEQREGGKGATWVMIRQK